MYGNIKYGLLLDYCQLKNQNILANVYFYCVQNGSIISNGKKRIIATTTVKIHGVCASLGGNDKYILTARYCSKSLWDIYIILSHNHIPRCVLFYRCGNPENQKYQKFNTLPFIQQGGGRRDAKQCIRLPGLLAIPLFILK